MISHVHIQTAARDGITRLKQVYCTPPFKVADITEDKKGNMLHVMLMSSSPGILDGDEYHLKIDVDEHCHLQLHTQSYQRLFHMKKGAQQQMQVHLYQP
jgi:urease accessory protein